MWESGPEPRATYRGRITQVRASTAEQDADVTAILNPVDRHLVSRFTFGCTPALTRDVRRLGRTAWFEQQLRPWKVADSEATATRAWWPDLDREPQDLWQRQITGVRAGWEVTADYGGWVLTRRIQSRRQVYEVMTSFWENHLHVPYDSDGWVWRMHYGSVIRSHALGRFDELLVAAITHPAMLIWLDGVRSTKAAPNENLGRELLELFTVGVGNHTEADVKDAAKILTGWQVDMWDTWEPFYDSDIHHVGPVQVGDFRHANADPDGRAVTRALLRHLARHPDTAQHLARKLVTKFVRDEPPAALVRRLARTYLEHDTAIAPVLRELVASPEFAASAGLKLRDPEEDVVATYRALGAKIERPADDEAATRAILWQTGILGSQLGSWPRPDGLPLTGTPWATTLRALAAADVHRTVANQWWPSRANQIRYPWLRSWVPRYPIRLDRLVDQVCRRLLCRPATPALVSAACLAVDLPATEVIRDDEHPLVQWEMGTLLTALLDSPEHYFR